ncbi:MAG: hypothetical protein DSZ10_05670 [Sulfurovum sp.]|nr:MAG: hypothetical protein DSZ10_05670 [Sulfurovum sp.]
MKIVFNKIGNSPKPISLNHQDMKLEGFLKKSGYHRVALDASLRGYTHLVCDRCGEIYRQDVDQKLILSLSDQVIEDKDDLDIIEFLDGVIDITYIVESEINAIEGSFHYCKRCEESKEALEIEY